MAINRMGLEIYSHAPIFRDRYKLKYSSSDYLYFEGVNRYNLSSVAIFRTSCKCYRVMYYKSRLSTDFEAEYKSFRSLASLCVYLDTKACKLSK